MKKILILLVIYRKLPSESSTLTSLLESYKSSYFIYDNLELIIFDNTESIRSIDINIPFEFQYISNGINLGLAEAYSFGLKYAFENKFEWMVLLDQDSILPNNYLKKLNGELERIGDEKICAVLPRIISLNKIISPCNEFLGGILRPIDKNKAGIAVNLFGIGSGAVINVNLFNKIGVNLDYHLDGLDRWIFESFNKLKYKFHISNIYIEHELSVMCLKKYMNIDRYKNILRYEYKFLNENRSGFDLLIYNLRLILRVIILLISNNYKYSKLNLKHLLRKY